MNKHIIATNCWPFLWKFSLYLSFKSNAFYISYQAENAGIGQTIVFRVLALCRGINLFWSFEDSRCFHVLGVSIFCFQADASSRIRRQQSEDYHLIFLNTMCSNLCSVKLPSALNLEIKVIVVPAMTAFTTVFHNESSWKEGHAKNLQSSLFLLLRCASL